METSAIAFLLLVAKSDGRIVGGETVYIEDYPYQVSLEMEGSHICGGSIIAPKFIATAAHCTDGSSASNLSVRVGSSFREYGGIESDVKTIYQHPEFTAYNDYDISILELSASLSYGPDVQNIALPNPGESIEEGATAVASGWGLTSEGGWSSEQLQAVEVNVVDLSKCKAIYEDAEVTERMLCASVQGGGKDACQGDSGGPLVSKDKLVGIVSWGAGCARPNHPGVYANVERLRTFVKETTGV